MVSTQGANYIEDGLIRIVLQFVKLNILFIKQTKLNWIYQ
jgi:hypothetical protein